MAQIARTGAEKAPTPASAKPATGNGAELPRRVVDQAAEVARGTAERAEDAARHDAESAQRAAAGTTELGRAFVELASEQARHNLETLKALTGAVDWSRVVKAVDWQQVLQIQGAYLRASVERATRLNRHYLQASQALMTSAASAAQRPAKKAA